MPLNKWNKEKAKPLQGLEQLVYRSNLLGSDRTIANWGGGNTSMKTTEHDFRGNNVEVMWVKGSGSDLAGMKAEHFTALRLNDMLSLLTRESMSDEEMVQYLTHCMINPRHPRMSIETLLHAFLPFKHLDHTHPDAIISICCADNGREAAKEIYGDRFVWVPYVRPGFTLSKMIAEGVKNKPSAEFVLMEKHGLVTWGETNEEAYQKTLAIIQEAENFLNAKIEQMGDRLYGGVTLPSLDPEKRKEIAAQIMPTIRGAVSSDKKMILNFDDGEDILRFIGSADAEKLSQVGAACPDHLVHTKRTPLYVKWDWANGDIADLKRMLADEIAYYSEEYSNYFNRYNRANNIMSEPAPRVILIPGLGMITTGKSKLMSEVSASLYRRAVAVMKGTSVIGEFQSLGEQESFEVEYWPLELYKLTLLPAETEFSRQVAFITGGAGGIGSATARTLLEGGTHVVLADINAEGTKKLAEEFNSIFGQGRALSVAMDVTGEEKVIAGFKEAVLYYGGVDLLVNNAGLGTSSPFENTSIDEWNLNISVLATGYFLVAREAYRLMKEQGIGGSMVFIGSKNSIFAGKNATAYSTAKAAEVHLARCIASEGGQYGIRVNSVLPDAVLQGSAIWNSNWRKERAANYGIEPEELETYYRKRTVLDVSIYPQDIAEAVSFLASSKASKTTGCMVTVDGGVAGAYTR
jgi:rhamnulose-1-phosphate aldolase/alcohol dehydrogenase